MTRLSFFLVLALVVSAVSLVTSQHRARELYKSLEAAAVQGRALDIEWGQLQLEQGTLSAHARVEGVARNELQMRVPAPVDLRVLEVPAS